MEPTFGGCSGAPSPLSLLPAPCSLLPAQEKNIKIILSMYLGRSLLLGPDLLFSSESRYEAKTWFVILALRWLKPRYPPDDCGCDGDAQLLRARSG